MHGHTVVVCRGAMEQLLRVFVDICLLRAGPQRLPASRFLLALVAVVHWVLGVTFASFNLALAQSLAAALIGTLLLLGMVQLLVALHRRPERFLQTAIALAGAEVLLGIAALPFSLWVYWGDAAPLLPSLLSLGIILWGVVVTMHIFRHALNVPHWIALLFAFGYTLLSYTLVGLIIPGA